jgi:hypothetical protein
MCNFPTHQGNQNIEISSHPSWNDYHQEFKQNQMWGNAVGRNVNKCSYYEKQYGGSLKTKIGWVLVAHTCNPNYLRG